MPVFLFTEEYNFSSFYPTTQWLTSSLLLCNFLTFPFIVQGKQFHSFIIFSHKHLAGFFSNQSLLRMAYTSTIWPEITSISDNQALNKGNRMSLNYTADGYLSPSITWTIFSDNSLVSFPLTIGNDVRRTSLTIQGLFSFAARINLFALEDGINVYSSHVTQILHSPFD